MKHFEVVTTKDEKPVRVDADRYDCRAPGYVCFMQGEKEVKLFSLANVVSWEEAKPTVPPTGRESEHHGTSFQDLYVQQYDKAREQARAED